MVFIMLFEDEIYCKDEKTETNEVVQREMFILEENDSEQGKDGERDDLLNDFELPKVKRTAIAGIADFIGGYLETIFKEGNAPADDNDEGKTDIAEPAHLLEFEMPVPCKSHENIGDNQ